MTTPKIKVVFVDGPTGSGKDYLLDTLESKLLEVNPEKRIAKIKAIDYVLKGPSSGEARKYVMHDIDEERLKVIYKGHYALVDAIAKKLEEGDCDLILVNRSILTMAAVNLWHVDYTKVRKDLIDKYAKYVDTKLKGVGILHVTVEPKGSNHYQKVDLLIERVTARNDGKEINRKWFETLLLSYNLNYKLMEECYRHSILVRSDQTELIYETFLK